MTSRKVMLGYTKDRARVYVTVGLTWHDSEMQTVQHETADGFWRLSMVGEVVEFAHRDAATAGQCSEYLLEVVDPEARTLDQIRDMHDTWERWHLNDLQAGCAHQRVVWEDSEYGRRPSLSDTLPCPESGYRYGSAWLTEPLPQDVLDKVSRFITHGEWVIQA